MKKQISKITLKTDKIVNLSKQDAQQVAGGMQPWGTLSKTCTENPGRHIAERTATHVITNPMAVRIAQTDLRSGGESAPVGAEQGVL
ncbi:hypothetical protein GCM10027190_50400 [Spirosoma areae]